MSIMASQLGRRLLAPLLVVGLLVAMPVLIPVAIVSSAVERHRMRKAARRFPCERCGRVLGLDALELADRIWGEELERIRAEHPFARLRIMRTCHAICPQCRTRYTYQSRERTFVIEVARGREGRGQE